jgi:hypothetical protein
VPGESLPALVVAKYCCALVPGRRGGWIALDASRADGG